MNPCPCGNYGSDQLCTCTPGEIRRYVRKISGPLLDRIDLHVRVERPLYRELVSDEAQEGSGCYPEPCHCSPETADRTVTAFWYVLQCPYGTQGYPGNVYRDKRGTEAPAGSV